MKRILSALLIIFFGFTVLFSPSMAFGQTASSSASRWVIDSEVTFIGKNAARAGLFLDWTLKNYNWVCVNKINDRQCDDSNNPIAKYWSLIVLYIVVPLLFFVILATSAVIIITRGKSLTIMRFIPRFVAVILLIVFSYSLLQFFYQFTDLIQGFFLRSNINSPCPPDCISQKDLLYVGWSYKDFVGLRLLGDQYAESAFISLLLTKLTALTYFVMVFMLLVRKIILWFFIVVSPIFPILLLYYPTRNTGKIWIGEFFRWLLYAPLFAIFLNGLVYLWKNQIPLVFVNSNIGNASQIVFPTAVNILLGGPKQLVTPTNSVNLIETFALYVVSLIMLWIVILLPWILLQIFLDYASNFSPGDTAVMKTLVNMATTRQQPPGGPVSPAPEGRAINLPFSKKFSIPKDLQPQPGGAAKEIAVPSRVTFNQPFNIPKATVTSANVNAEVLKAANIQLPTMRDIAKYDSALLSRDQSKQQEVSRITQTLEKIANPVAVTSTVEREQYKEIREKISQQREKGNLVANSIMNAANVVSQKNTQVSTQQMKNVLKQMANPTLASSKDRATMSKVNEKLIKESKSGGVNSSLASSILAVTDKTSDKEIERIKGQLSQVQKGTTSLSSSVLSTISRSQQVGNTTQLHNVLQKIANPASVTNTVDREQYAKLNSQLAKESKENNNQIATSILSVSTKTSTAELERIQQQLALGKDQPNSVSSVVSSMVQTMQAKEVLQQIANPASVTNVTEREKFSKLHEMLSKEQNNQLATSILAVNDSTSIAEIEKIQNSLKETSEKDTVASSIMSAVKDASTKEQSMTQVKDLLQQVANPTASVTAADREKLTKLNQSLLKSSKEGNQLAASILSVSSKTPIEEIEKLQEKINEAKQKGEPIATEVSSITQTATPAGLPMINKLQTVKKEDYQAVRDMWKQNYQNLEVPEGMAGTRTDWIKDDIANIDTTVALLSSANPEDVKQGMEQVSNILPFLLVGGFSQTEIIAYLQAKQEAAKEVSKMLTVEEEEKVTVNVQKTQAQRAMTATMEDTDVSSESEDESTLTNVATTAVSTPSQSSVPMLQIADLQLPKMKDIAAYETQQLKKDPTAVAESQRVQTVLQKIATPQEITDPAERTKYEGIRNNLIEERVKGNRSAAAVLSAARKTRNTAPADVKTVLSQIANPASITKEEERKRVEKLHESLKQASEQGNTLATAILSTKDVTSVEDVKHLSEKLKEAKAQGEPVAKSVLEHVADEMGSPEENSLQPVSQTDFDEVEKMWEENYRTLPVPAEFGSDTNGRIKWIESDLKIIEETTTLLNAPDTEEQQKGMNKVSNILPMLLLGGFSQQEIIGYLNAKAKAGKTVLTELQKEEENSVTVAATPEKQETANTLEAEAMPEEKKTD